MNIEEIKSQLKSIVVDRLKLKIKPESIQDDMPLFGVGDDRGGLGLDSVEMLTLVVAIEEVYHVKVENDVDPQTFRSISVIGEYIHNALTNQVGRV